MLNSESLLLPNVTAFDGYMSDTVPIISYCQS